MAQIFALSGASGTGKTVTLEVLKNRGYWVNNISITRGVLESMQLPLDKITENYELIHIFQENIKKNMDMRLVSLERSELKPMFIDRSHGDLYGYAKIWENVHTSEISKWLEIYERNLVGHAQSLTLTFVFPPGKFDHVDDGVRADAWTQQPVHDAIIEFYDRHNIDYHIVESITPDDRADEIISVSKEYIL